jgi:glutamine synthetase
MTADTYLTAEEARAFLTAHPSVTWIDVLMFDINGVARGKRVRPADLPGLADKGILVPSTVYIMDIRGNCVEDTGLLWETGDPDLEFKILAGTLSEVPVNGSTHAQAVMVPVESTGGLDPRSILQAQTGKLADKGLTAVCAVELEFYVTQRSDTGQFELKTPKGLADAADSPKLYQFEELDCLRPFVDDVYRIAAAQNIPVDAIIQEAGPGQFEINLKHKADVCAAALDGLLLKRAVKAAALAHGMEATFMAKPHHEWSGSGMHIHMSLIDQNGKNVFAGDPISPLFRHALGGLQATMADFMAVWAQSANAYRRYVPKSYVPMAAHWGFNNRNVALRIPRGTGAATRVEHRVAGADANPFLVLAAIMAGMLHGIDKAIEPSKEMQGNIESTPAPLLPTAWNCALERFETSSVARNAFGKPFWDVYAQVKQAERSNFERIVTSLDHLWYAQVA